mmetsp:Transcript_26752/g.39711  ORF Transcript_26752/g.39711 Transcript_26752/m.39711 type:complete len:193 (+) Transcript_26752:71-649(+)|eukprot:CAMPEP_0185020116 /NCGR_PEP_ID=MMETSP1103-20130426/2724_1 /TAXON_ID=36769 /ORGANISM="Paraphysomonas bandaiensis, Strain Caron Lab Isolate" /LENGTH=192 /DNA_ID=CAMNT_0027550831 /DNA_START=23 /DNA_END=601 /DNA_ORIENTATION=-
MTFISIITLSPHGDDNESEILTYLQADYTRELLASNLGVTAVEISKITINTNKKIEIRQYIDNHEKYNVFISNTLTLLSNALEERFVDTNKAHEIETYTGERILRQGNEQTHMESHSSHAHGHGHGIQRDKSKWPELKNKPLDEVVTIIKSERPDLKVLEVPQGAMVTMDVRMDRVRVYHRDGKVTTVPKIG